MEISKIDILFDNRVKIGEHIFRIMKDKGYTKINFSKITDITRPTLNKLFKGEIENKKTFENHISKITHSMHIAVEDILNYNNELNCESLTICSNNFLVNHEFNNKAREMFNILDDLINLCEIYY